MRIVAGTHRGRVLRAPKGRKIRPTADRARQKLFDILAHRRFDAGDFEFAGARVLDAFCGTGALGLEALSRGADEAVFLDSDPEALGMARENARELGEEAHAKFVLADATNPPQAPAPCDLVFLDPPYGSGLGARALTALMARGWIRPGVLAVLEMAAREDFAPPPEFVLLEERRVGAAKFVILRNRRP